MKKSPGSKILLLAIILCLIWMFFLFDLDHFFSLSNLKNELEAFQAYFRQNRIITMVIYMAVYVIVAALSLPAATVMTLAGGAVFGLFYGTLLVSFSSTIGATLAFLFSRYLFKEWVQNRFSSKLPAVNKGMEKEGGFYLFTLRLVPIFPFFVINLVMGLTTIRTRVFYIVSQVGMLPGTIIFVNAGTMLAKIESARQILSLKIILSFVLLGIFPILAKRFVEIARKRKLFFQN